MNVEKKASSKALPRTAVAMRRTAKPERLSAERYHELFFALAEGVVMLSNTGEVIAVNPSAESILGMDVHEMASALRHDEVWHAVTVAGNPFSREDFPIRKTLRTGKPLRDVVVGIRLDGKTLRWLQVNTQPVFAPNSSTPSAVVASFEDVTLHRQVEAEHARLAAAINASPDAITSADLEHKYISWNPGAERLFGYSAKEALGRPVGWMVPESKRQELRDLRERVLNGDTISAWATERTRKDGQHIFIESNYAPIRDALGQITGIVGVHRDVSPVKRMLMQIESSKELFRLALNGIPDTFLIYDPALKIQFVNERGTEFYARRSADILGKGDEDLLPAEVTQTYLPALRQALATQLTQSLELGFSLRGRQYSINATFVPMIDSDGELRQILGLLHDFTKRRQTEERLAFMAQYDALTGLPNRYLLLDRLDAAMQRARRSNTLLGVMFLDIDRFKQINDSHGHATGDILLQQIAERLATHLRATDTIARLGGDEFTVLVENATTVDEITTIAEKIKNAFTTPFDTESGEVFTTTSVGITIYPFDDHNRDELLKNADVAMYHAKQERNAWQLYQPDMNINSAGRLGMEIELRHALVRNEFELHFQPQLNVRSGNVVGMEALIRWNNAALGRVSPADFIPLAEDTGLIVPIGEWILRAACAQCKAWENAGLSPFLVSVNIAAPQFRRSNLLQLVSAVLTEYDLDPRWLGLEITESSIMKHAEQTIKTLFDLREIGVSISIDDFGTGYSSLSYLKRFPVNKIKVDQSFVRDIGTDPNDAAIVSAVIAMSKQLGIRTVAEGVETQAQLEFLSRLDCDEYQGYLFSKPVPAAEVLPLMQRRPLKLMHAG
jgi:diguanylate cyclase (GGDEF)-like protein/PAS domain S-box-containing protein